MIAIQKEKNEMENYEWIVEMQKRIKEVKEKRKNMINLKLFDKWLDQQLYIRPKYKRNEIIQAYKKCLRESKNISDFESILDEIGWDEITYNNITNYIVNYDFRRRENMKLEV